MKYLVIVLLCAFYGIVPHTAAPPLCSTSDTGVQSNEPFWKGIDGGELIDDLTDKNFDKWVADNPKGFVMFYSTTCRYCKESREGFGGAAKEMKDKVKFGGVDCKKSPTVCRSGGKAKTGYPRISGYPTFYLFKDGKYSDEFKYERSTEMFVAWLTPRVEESEK